MYKKSNRTGIGSLGEFEVLVLTSVIAAGDEAYGVTIHEELEQLVPPSREVSLGSVYTTLDRLERKGYLKSWTGDPTPERGGRAKRYYEVQASGQRALRVALEPMKKAWQIVEERG
jgi:DNA-binding PadR family transcriptional regulator